jgi:multidrug efflux pump subunit AcrB
MLKSLITYFARRHLLVNLIALIVFLGGAISWQSTSKEEMPTSHLIRYALVFATREHPQKTLST